MKVDIELDLLFSFRIQFHGNINSPSGDLRPDDLFDTVFKWTESLRKFDVDIAIAVVDGP
jgi:hypothetical protein